MIRESGSLQVQRRCASVRSSIKVLIQLAGFEVIESRLNASLLSGVGSRGVVPGRLPGGGAAPLLLCKLPRGWETPARLRNRAHCRNPPKLFTLVTTCTARVGDATYDSRQRPPPRTAKFIMPPTKRQKKTAGAQSQNTDPPPTAADPASEGQSEFAQLAKQHWLKPSKKATKVKVKNDVLKRDIWDPLEKDKFPLSSLLALEGLQILERSDCPSCLSRVVSLTICAATSGPATASNPRTTTSF